MSRTDSRDDAAAARRYVRVDAGDAGAAAELTSWLAERPEHERALERIDLAVALGKRLAAEPSNALHAEAARAASGVSRRRAVARRLAWSGALAAALVVAIVALPDGGVPSPVVPQPAALRAAQLVAVEAPINSAAVLPAGIVVDASAVAVMPFAAPGEGTLARGLERDVVAALRGVPGLYVIAGDAAQPYAGSELAAAEIGGQLGARGIVDATVELAAGRVRVSAQLRDAATGATLWRTEADRPIDELSAIRYEIADSVATAMLDSGLRERAGGVAAGKPVIQ